MAHLDMVVSTVLPIPTRRVAFVLQEHFSMTAFTDAVDALVTANLLSSVPLFELLVVGATGNQVISDLGIAISASGCLSELNETLQDILIVCGGPRVRLEGEPRLRAKLISADAAGAALGGLWNGAYFLAEAGLLDGHKCAMHLDGQSIVTEHFPKVKVAGSSYVLDGRRFSCAGARSSQGMMLEVLRHCAGEGLVSAIESILSCDKVREIVDESAVTVGANLAWPQPLKLALELIHSNIEEPIGVDEIAGYVGISRRHLERLFCRYINISPSRYYIELRLKLARQLLQNTNKPLTEIAIASGFANMPHFQLCFRKLFGVAPRQFRARTQFRV